MTQRNGSESANAYVSLKDYIEAKLAAMALAIKLAKENMDIRLEGMNGLRSDLREAQARASTRPEHDALAKEIAVLRAMMGEHTSGSITRSEHDALAKEVGTLALSKAKLEGKASQNSVIWAMVIAVIGIIVGLIGIFMKKGL